MTETALPALTRSDDVSRVVGAAGKSVWDLAVRLLEGVSPGDVLEAAGGGGPIASVLGPRGFRIVGADLVNQWRADSAFVRLDLDSPLPFAAESFDVVTLVEALGYLESAPAVLREFARVLRPGGALIITMPNILSLRSRLRFLLNGTYRWFPHPQDRGGTKAQLADVYRDPVRATTLAFYLRRAGFEVEETDFGGERSSTLALPACWFLAAVTGLHNRARGGRGSVTPPTVNSANSLLHSHVGIRARLSVASSKNRLRTVTEMK